MLVNLLSPILDLNGEPANPPIVLKDVVQQAFAVQLRSDEGMTTEQKLAAYDLWRACATADSIELSKEQADMVLDRAGRVFGIVITGRVRDLLTSSSATA